MWSAFMFLAFAGTFLQNVMRSSYNVVYFNGTSTSYLYINYIYIYTPTFIFKYNKNMTVYNIYTNIHTHLHLMYTLANN